MRNEKIIKNSKLKSYPFNIKFILFCFYLCNNVLLLNLLNFIIKNCFY